jgi:hypothetical protein
MQNRECQIFLRNCPFCGSQANLLVEPSGVSVRCRKCLIRTPYHIDDTNGLRAIREAVEEWNRRVNDG